MNREPTFNDVDAYAAAGWEVVFLRGKVPAISARDDGRGVLDATTDISWLRSRWRPGYNIGARVPEGIVVVDTDPRHGGEAALLQVADRFGGLPTTLTCLSGRGDGGRHRYFLHPGGKVGARRLPVGVDLKTHSGYAVLPPSLHPDSGKPYTWEDSDASIARCPEWLAKLLAPEPEREPGRPFTPRVVNDAESIADWFSANTTWADVLEPAGWREVTGGWRHPNATSPISATIRHELLFVYSPNTPFEPTEAGNPHGYTRFRAWAVLNHRGNLSVAAKAARALRERRAAA